MSAIRDSLTASVVDGRIYAIGGMVGSPGLGSSAVEVYDPATDTWTRKASMPTARCCHAACVVDGRIYILGGATKYDGGEFPCVPTVEVYDPAIDTWTQSSDMPWPRMSHSASVVDGKIYIIGGRDTEVGRRLAAGEITLEELAELFESVDVYDPKTDTWTTAARCPFSTVGHAAGVVDGRIYEIGGWYASSIIPSIVYEFDPGLPGSIAITSPAGKLLGTWGQVKSE